MARIYRKREYRGEGDAPAGGSMSDVPTVTATSSVDTDIQNVATDSTTVVFP
jgi:hypothetical protein